MSAMDALPGRGFAFATAMLLLAGAGLTTLMTPAAKVSAAEPAPSTLADDMQRMMMMGPPGMMGGMGGGMMCPMCAGMTGGGMMAGDVETLDMLSLTDAQREKVDRLQNDQRKKNWSTYGRILDEQARLRVLFEADPPDAKKIGAAYGSIGRLQAQLLEMQAEHRNRVMAVLTQDQQERLKRWQGESGMGMMGPAGMMAR